MTEANWRDGEAGDSVGNRGDSEQRPGGGGRGPEERRCRAPPSRHPSPSPRCSSSATSRSSAAPRSSASVPARVVQRLPVPPPRYNRRLPGPRRPPPAAARAASGFRGPGPQRRRVRAGPQEQFLAEARRRVRVTRCSGPMSCQWATPAPPAVDCFGPAGGRPAGGAQARLRRRPLSLSAAMLVTRESRPGVPR